jgi:glycosyltransferase involved in cell wall biosynthesis
MVELLFECVPEGWHPYQELFARALARHGVSFRPVRHFSNRALVERSEVHGIHFHWAEYLWGAASWWKRPRLIWGVSSYCRLAKRLGKRIVWTVHNHGPHEGPSWADWVGFRIVAGMADLVIVHSKWSEEFVRREYRPAGRVVRMPLGNFDGLYTARRTPAAVRADLGLDPARPVCGLIGGVRPYRGHDLAIAAARVAAGRWQLLVAGHPIDPVYGRRVADQAARCPDIRLRLGMLTDTEYAELVRACDIILLPYEGITGSAALLAAWTLSRPVVMSDLPYFREFRPDDEAAGLVLPERIPAALNACIDRLMAVPADRRTAAAREVARIYDWDEVIRPVADVFREWLELPVMAP